MSLKLAALVALTFLSAAPSFAQTRENAYASVGDWRIVVTSPAGQSSACRALLPSEDGRLAIALTDKGNAALIVPQRQDFTGVGSGVVTIDSVAMNMQFKFSKKAARAPLTDAQIAALQTGKTLSVQIPGLKTRSWSLAGFATVFQTLNTCVTTRGKG